MKLLNAGGLLASFSYLSAISPKIFKKILASSAEDAEQDFSILDKFSADQKEILYLRNLIASKENLKEKARIWLSTIHAIKGGEEDNVILSLHQGRTVQQGIKSSIDKQDEEHRVWYVGITRARNNLYKLKSKKKIKEYQL